MSATEQLAGLLATGAGTSLDTGVVEVVTDASHVQVDIGERSVPAFMPSSLAGAASVGSTVLLLVQQDTHIVLDVTSGAWIGEVRMLATATIPAGWLLCDGSTFSAATYPLLNTLLGGTTLPDFRDRFPVGKSATKALRSTGGSATITEAQLPEHDHGGVPERTTATYVASYGATFHGITSTDVATDTAGSGDDYWQPYYAVNYIIKAA